MESICIMFISIQISQMSSTAPDSYDGDIDSDYHVSIIFDEDMQDWYTHMYISDSESEIDGMYIV